MIKIGKRTTREWTEEVTPQCSPHKIYSMDSTPTKRIRFFGEDDQNTVIREPSPTRRESPFNPSEMEVQSPNEHYLVKRKQKDVKERNNDEKLYTYNEVREIVNRMLAERETQLRAEYDRILQERLAEQFRNFAKFNEDYISRQLKQSDFSYFS